MSRPAKPRAFALDDSSVAVEPLSEAPVPAYRHGTEPVASPTQLASQTGFSRWTKLFLAGLSALLSLMLGLMAARLITDLFTYSSLLGWIGLVILALTLLAAIVIISREALILRRLARVDRTRTAAEIALANGRDAAASDICDDLVALQQKNPLSAGTLAEYHRACHDAVIDGRDRLRLFERLVVEPLDRQATRLVAEAARRVSIATALSPRAFIDLAFVFFNTVVLIRRLAELYGGRPGTLGLWRLLRHVLAHLALTGGMATGDDLLHQMLGESLASKVSAKLGMGVVNGLLTTRLGLAAIAQTRPLPYIGAPKPDVRDFFADLLGRGEAQDAMRGSKTDGKASGA